MTQTEEDEMIAAKAATAARRFAALSRPEPEPIAPTVTVQRRIPAICGTCCQPFEAIEATTALITLTQRHCEACVERHEADYQRMVDGEAGPAVDKSAEWAKVCPTEFRTIAEGGATDPALLAQKCPRLAEIMAAESGLLIRGDTGLCKTRAMFRMMRRFFDRGESVVALTSGKFARQYQDAAGSFTTGPWFDGIASAGAFFIDDLGRAPWTPNVWGQFFELIDDRAKNHRPFFITSNETAATLKAKCVDAVTWEPLNRRLKDNCHLITLTEEPQPK